LFWRPGLLFLQFFLSRRKSFFSLPLLSATLVGKPEFFRARQFTRIFFSFLFPLTARFFFPRSRMFRVFPLFFRHTTQIFLLLYAGCDPYVLSSPPWGYFFPVQQSLFHGLSHHPDRRVFFTPEEIALFLYFSHPPPLYQNEIRSSPPCSIFVL